MGHLTLWPEHYEYVIKNHKLSYVMADMGACTNHVDKRGGGGCWDDHNT